MDGVDLIERLMSEEEYDMLRRGQIDLRDVVGETNVFPYKRGTTIDIPKENQVIDPLTGKPYLTKLRVPDVIVQDVYAPAAIPQQVASAGETGAAVTAKQEQGLPSRLLNDRELEIGRAHV